MLSGERELDQAQLVEVGVKRVGLGVQGNHPGAGCPGADPRNARRLVDELGVQLLVSGHRRDASRRAGAAQATERTTFGRGRGRITARLSACEKCCRDPSAVPRTSRASAPRAPQHACGAPAEAHPARGARVDGRGRAQAGGGPGHPGHPDRRAVHRRGARGAAALAPGPARRHRGWPGVPARPRDHGSRRADPADAGRPRGGGGARTAASGPMASASTSTGCRTPATSAA